MVDAVTSNVALNNRNVYVIHLTNISDGTGEAAVIKVDKSTLLDANAAEPAALDIISCRWSIQGFASVRILWDHTTDDLALALAGSGYDEFGDAKIGVNVIAGRALPDPRSAGGAGDILLTTNGAVSGATYDITLVCLKRTE